MNWVSERQLTEVLRRSGRLTWGEVVSMTIGPPPFKTIMSTIFELDIEYSADSLGELPDTCLLKVVEPGNFLLGRSEVYFYRFAARHSVGGLVECHGTFIDEAEQIAFCLLENHREPQVQTEWPIPPGADTCARAVEAAATVHAHWWNSREVERIVAGGHMPLWNTERLNARMAALFDKLGDALSSERRALIESLVERFPELHESRLLESDRQTIVHGDAHLWNFLIPTDTARPAVLIDWQLWGADFGTADLAYMMALHWFPERRSRFEQDLVRVWARSLEKQGVDCGFETAWTDYRFMATGLLPRVVNYAAVIPANIWWPHLERALLAYEDLDCAEFLC